MITKLNEVTYKNWPLRKEFGFQGLVGLFLLALFISLWRNSFCRWHTAEIQAKQFYPCTILCKWDACPIAIPLWSPFCHSTVFTVYPFLVFPLPSKTLRENVFTGCYLCCSPALPLTLLSMDESSAHRLPHWHLATLGAGTGHSSSQNPVSTLC